MLSNQQPFPPRDQRSMLTRSVEHAITLAAAAVSLFGGMALYDATRAPIRQLATGIYGAGDLTNLISTLIWGGLCYALVFCVARASLLALWLLAAMVILRYGAGLAF
jgi:hypothetical protein